MAKGIVFAYPVLVVLFFGIEPNTLAAEVEQATQFNKSESGPTKTGRQEPDGMHIPQAEMFNDGEAPSHSVGIPRLEVETRIDEASETAHITWEPAENAHYYVLWQLSGQSACLNVILWIGDDYSYETDVLDGSRFQVTAYIDNGQEGIEDDTLLACGYTQFLTLSSEPSDIPKRHASTKPHERYIIVVDKKAHAMGVYEKGKDGRYDRPVENFPVATGRRRRQTPTGTFRIGGKYAWKRFPYRGNWAPYVSCFTEHGIYIHGPIYRTPKDRGSMFPRAYKEIGSNATSGCLRTTYYGAYWIYTRCPRGTVIKITNSGTGLTYPTKPARDPRYPSWDPTDPDKPKL